jgi:hypothetical protein
MPRARPPRLNDRLAAKICDQLAAGASLRKICAAPGMPSREVVARWAIDDPGFREKYEEAVRLKIEDGAALIPAEQLDLPRVARAMMAVIESVPGGRNHQRTIDAAPRVALPPPDPDDVERQRRAAMMTGSLSRPLSARPMGCP